MLASLVQSFFERSENFGGISRKAAPDNASFECTILAILAY